MGGSPRASGCAVAVAWACTEPTAGAGTCTGRGAAAPRFGACDGGGMATGAPTSWLLLPLPLWLPCLPIPALSSLMSVGNAGPAGTASNTCSCVAWVVGAQGGVFDARSMVASLVAAAHVDDDRVADGCSRAVTADEGSTAASLMPMGASATTAASATSSSRRIVALDGAGVGRWAPISAVASVSVSAGPWRDGSRGIPAVLARAGSTPAVAHGTEGASSSAFGAVDGRLVPSSGRLRPCPGEDRCPSSAVARESSFVEELIVGSTVLPSVGCEVAMAARPGVCRARLTPGHGHL